MEVAAFEKAADEEALLGVDVHKVDYVTANMDKEVDRSELVL